MIYKGIHSFRFAFTTQLIQEVLITTRRNKYSQGYTRIEYLIKKNKTRNDKKQRAYN